MKNKLRAPNEPDAAAQALEQLKVAEGEYRQKSVDALRHVLDVVAQSPDLAANDVAWHRILADVNNAAQALAKLQLAHCESLTDAVSRNPLSDAASSAAATVAAAYAAAMRAVTTQLMAESIDRYKREAVIERAVEVIGDREQTMRWLGTPVRALEYATPISRLDDPQGQADVLRVLTQLEHGVL